MIWVYLEGPWNGKCWYILWPFGNYVVIWYIFPVLVYYTKKKSGNPGLKPVTTFYSILRSVTLTSEL
jgi:hypothetical protein